MCMNKLNSNTVRSNASAPLYIETNEFLLRSLIPSDASPAMVKWLNSPKLLEGLNLPPLNFDEKSLTKFIASFDNVRNYIIGIFSPEKRELIGFYTIDINATHKVANITSGLTGQFSMGTNIHGSDLRKKGPLWATIDALLDFFFTYKNVDKFTARILSNNRRMLFNMMGSPRFVLEARLYKDCITQNGERVDVLVFCAFKNRLDNEKASKGYK